MAVSANLGQASIAIRATLDQLDGDLEKARGKTDSAIKRISKGVTQGMGTVGAGVVGGVGLVTGALGALAVGVGKMSLNTTVYDSQRKAFASMTEGIVDDTDAFIDAVQDATATTVSRSDVMGSALETFGMIGTDVFTNFEQDYIDMATMSRRTGRALGKDTQEVMDIIVSAVSTGNTQYLRRLGIQVSVSDAQEMYAKSIDKEVSALTEAEKKAAIYHLAMDRLGESYGDVAVSSGGLGVILAQTRVWWADLTTAIGMKVMPLMSTLGGTVIPLVTGAVEALWPSFEGLVGWLEVGAGYFADFIGRLGAGVDPMLAIQYLLEDIGGIGFAQAVMEWVDKIRDFISAAWDVIGPIVNWLAETVSLKDVIMVLAIAVGVFLFGALKAVVIAIAPVIGAFLWVLSVVVLLRQAWENNFLGIQDKTQVVMEWLKEFIPQAIEFVRGVIETALTFIQEFWAQHGNSIMATVTTAFETIETVIDTVIQFITNLIGVALEEIQGFWDRHGENIMATVNEAFETILHIVGVVIAEVQSIIKTALVAIQTFWSAHGRDLMRVARYSWNQIRRIIDIAITLVLGIVRTVMAVLRGDWEGAWEIIKETAASVWATLEEIVASAMDFLRESIGRIMGDINMTWSEIWEAIKEKASEIWESIKSSVSDGARAILDKVSSLVRDVKNKFTSINWGDVGMSIVRGIADGVTRGAGAIADAARAAATSALQAAKDFLRIGSPSRKSAKEIGAPFVLGIANQIERDMKAFSNRMPRLMDVLIQPAVVQETDMVGYNGDSQINIYGLTLEGVSNKESLLQELQSLT